MVPFSYTATSLHRGAGPLDTQSAKISLFVPSPGVCVAMADDAAAAHRAMIAHRSAEPLRPPVAVAWMRAKGRISMAGWLLPRGRPARHMGFMPPLTIQGVPKRSTSMPKPSAQKVLSNGMPTVPPAARASKMRFPSAAVG